MNEELYEMYKRNFPNNIRNVQTEKDILFNPNNHLIIRKNNYNKLCAISLINENTIILLCVDKEYRNQGLGSSLLDESESYILDKGYDKLNIGAGYDYLMPGIPITNKNITFFEKRGYYHGWGKDECFDMDMSLKDINYNMNVDDSIKGIIYRFATIEDLKEINNCVSDAEPSFVEYYNNKHLYEADNDQKVLIADKDKEICGTLIVSIETEAPNTGSVGCTTTKTKYRHQGIATNLVKIGTKYLQNIGLKYGHLGYTYTGLDKMYGSAGYHVTQKYMMAEKQLVKEKYIK